MPLLGRWTRWAAAPHLSARATDARLWNDEEDAARGPRCPSAAALRSAEAAGVGVAAPPSETILERDWEPLAILDQAIAPPATLRSLAWIGKAPAIVWGRRTTEFISKPMVYVQVAA
jgi:hypothetical protein